MSSGRVLAFPAEPVGSVYLLAEGTKPEQLPAQGDIDVPEGSTAFLLLDESAAPCLPYLDGLDSDVVVGVQAKQVDPVGVALLARQAGVKQLSLGGVLDDTTLGLLDGLSSLEQLDVTLDGAAGPGLASLAQGPLRGLRLHGDPGEALDALARSATLTNLHFHAHALSLPQVRSLATSTHLDNLDVEVTELLGDADPDVVAALVAVASGLTSLSITTEDQGSGVTTALQLAVVRSCPGLRFNGAAYTAAAVARLERKLVAS